MFFFPPLTLNLILDKSKFQIKLFIGPGFGVFHPAIKTKKILTEAKHTYVY